MHPIGRVEKVELHREGVVITAATGHKILFCAVADGIVRVVLANRLGQFEAPTVGVTPYQVASSFDTTETDTAIVLVGAGCRVTVVRDTFAIEIARDDAGAVTRQVRLFRTHDDKTLIRVSARENTHFYGLGEKPGHLDKRHDAYTMWNSDVYAPHVPEMEALYVSIPFVIAFESEEASGLFLDNPGKTRFDFRSNAPDFDIHSDHGEPDLYLLQGPSMKEVIRCYTHLTGRMPLPPRWALGYHQSRYSYMSQDEVMKLVDTFEEKQIPLDAVYLDIHYMNGYRVFTFDRDRFPDPKTMVGQLKNRGVRIVPIVDPGVKQDPLYPVYRDGIANDVFCKTAEGELFIGDVWPGASAFPDFTEERVATWWKTQQQFYVDLGITGIWNDMNEPAVFNESKTMDLNVMHRNNGTPKTHGELHNLYGTLMSKATYEGLVEGIGGERPFVLTRAGYAGVQRHAAVWTGDNRSFWEHMAMAMPMVLNMGLSGIAFGGPDVGGFAHHATGELLARWTQMGAFFPFFRNHSALETVRQEPWSFGEVTERIVRKYIELRVAWMPYLYTAFREASETGLPVMRPLVLEYPDDAATYQLDDQFLCGRDLLVAPVYRPGATCRAVYLPHGTWENNWTGERIQGGRHILVDAPIDTMPMFVRCGSIIAKRPKDMPSTKLVLDVYVPEQDECVTSYFYEDDELTFGYQKGEYNEWAFELIRESNQVRLSGQVLHQGYAGGAKEVTLRIHSGAAQVLELKPDQGLAFSCSVSV